MRLLRSLLAYTSVVLRTLFRDPVALFFVLVLPVAVIVIIGSAFGGPGRIPLAVVDADTGPLSARLVGGLGDQPGLEVETYHDRTEAVRDVRRRMVAAAVVVPASFSTDLAAGRASAVDVVIMQETQEGLTARVAVEGVVDEVAAEVGAAQIVTRVVGGDFAENLAVAGDATRQGSVVRVEVVDVGRPRESALSRFSLTAPQNLVLFVFINSMATSAFLVIARRSGVLKRALATSTPMWAQLAGLALGWFVFAMIQSLIILTIGAVAFGVDWGDPIGAALLTVVFALVGCGAGLLVGAIGRDEDRVSAITPIVGMVLGAIGGCMVPLEVFPPFMQTLAHATPHYWAITAWQELVFDGGGVAGITTSLAVLGAIAVALVVAATAVLRRQLSAG